MSIYPGALAPRFVGATVSNPRYPSAAFGGRYVLLAFLPTDSIAREAAFGQMVKHRALFDDVKMSAFGVLRDEASIAKARDQVGLRWFLDHDAAISRLFDALSEAGNNQPRWVLIDPFECVQAWTPIENGERFFALVRSLPAPQDHAGVPLTAPVLIAPRILDPELCQALIAYYEADGGEPSGVMREVDGKTVPALDSYKRRRDAYISDMALIGRVRLALSRRLLPQIRKAFQYDVVCNGYELASGGIRNHIPEAMVKAFGIAGYPPETVEQRFGGMYRAFQYGAPPHGGMAAGIDRIVMLLCGTRNLREVALFPMNQQANDLLMGAPAEATPKQLKELHVRISTLEKKP